MKLLLAIGTLSLALPILQTRPRASLTASECKCSIEVTVKRQSNGEPISDVAVTVTNVTQESIIPVVLAARTDDAGRASFSNLAEGTYSLTARRDGYFDSTAYGDPKADATEHLSVGPAPGRDPAPRLAITLFQGATISGRIQDANHRAAKNISVEAIRVTYQFGRRVLRQAGNPVSTDDLGAFRLFWFAPGEYFIRTTALQGTQGSAQNTNLPIATYFPGTNDPESATLVALQEGQDYGGADFVMQTSPGVTISGTIVKPIQDSKPVSDIPAVQNARPGGTGFPPFTPTANISYYLVRQDSGFAEIPQKLPVSIISNSRSGSTFGPAKDATTDTRFEIHAVPPGSYEFFAIQNGLPGDRGGGRPATFTGQAVVQVNSENVSGVQVVLQPTVDVKGHLSPPENVTLKNIRLQIRAADNRPEPAESRVAPGIAVDANGLFTIPNVAAGKYFIGEVSGLPSNFYVSDIRQGPRSIFDDNIMTIGSAMPDPLEIVIRRGGGSLQWTLEDSQHKATGTAHVFLIPYQPRRRNFLLYQGATLINTTGTFSMTGIAPGSYSLFAWESIPDGAEQNEEFMKRYEALGTRVLVNEGIPLSNIQVQVIPENR